MKGVWLTKCIGSLSTSKGIVDPHESSYWIAKIVQRSLSKNSIFKEVIDLPHVMKGVSLNSQNARGLFLHPKADVNIEPHEASKWIAKATIVERSLSQTYWSGAMQICNRDGLLCVFMRDVNVNCKSHFCIEYRICIMMTRGNVLSCSGNLECLSLRSCWEAKRG